MAGLLADLCSAVDATRRAITCHMEREEADVLPLLQARLCASQQRDMVWRTLCAMPLRLLERVLPWLAGALYFPPQPGLRLWPFEPSKSLRRPQAAGGGGIQQYCSLGEFVLFCMCMDSLCCSITSK